jgi:osmotically inducible protein OsmC
MHSKQVPPRKAAQPKFMRYIRQYGLRLEASVPGMDEATFQKIAAKAKQDCPLSKALASVPEISLTAILR